MKDYFYGITPGGPQPRLTVLPWLIWFLILVCVVWATKAYGAPIFQAVVGTTAIVLTDEDCQLKQVTNLKKRATWTDGPKVYEGCWGMHQDAGMVLAYFSDGAVVIFPPQIFQRVSGA